MPASTLIPSRATCWWLCVCVSKMTRCNSLMRRLLISKVELYHERRLLFLVPSAFRCRFLRNLDYQAFNNLHLLEVLRLTRLFSCNPSLLLLNLQLFTPTCSAIQYLRPMTTWLVVQSFPVCLLKKDTVSLFERAVMLLRRTFRDPVGFVSGNVRVDVLGPTSLSFRGGDGDSGDARHRFWWCLRHRQ